MGRGTTAAEVAVDGEFGAVVPLCRSPRGERVPDVTGTHYRPGSRIAIPRDPRDRGGAAVTPKSTFTIASRTPTSRDS